jgi:hypothetical protein
MHRLKQQNAFGWTDISVHVSFICFYFYLNAMLPHSQFLFTSMEKISGRRFKNIT